MRTFLIAMLLLAAAVAACQREADEDWQQSRRATPTDSTAADSIRAGFVLTIDTTWQVYRRLTF